MCGDIHVMFETVLTVKMVYQLEEHVTYLV